MNKRFVGLALATVVAIGTIAVADEGGGNAGWRGSRTTTTSIRTTAAESGLVGIKLYDTGVRVVTVYGTPIEVQAVGGGGGSVGPTAGGGGGAPGGGGGGNNLGGGQSDAAPQIRNQNRAFSFGDDILLRRQAAAPSGGPSNDPAGGDSSSASAGGGAGGAGGGGAAGGRILYTRWVYDRGASRYAFVLDNSNRVVQIEAIGSSDARVVTNRGIRFGSTFADIIKRYGDPDGYEIANDTIVVRYLVRSKVAFRLNRLAPERPHVVTGVVVAAGKA